MTFVQQRNRLTTHFSERIPVVKRRISVLARPKRIILVKHCKPATLRTIHPATGGHIPEGRSTPLSACSDTRWDATSYYSHSRNETDAATHERTPKQHRKPKEIPPHHTSPNTITEDLTTHKSNRFILIFSTADWPRHLPSHFLPSNIHVLSKLHNFNKSPTYLKVVQILSRFLCPIASVS